MYDSACGLEEQYSGFPVFIFISNYWQVVSFAELWTIKFKIPHAHHQIQNRYLGFSNKPSHHAMHQVLRDAKLGQDGNDWG